MLFRLNNWVLILSITLGLMPSRGHANTFIQPTIYLIPGQGSDYRLFKNLQIDSNYRVEHIHYSVPEKLWNMNDFAHHLSQQIDTTKPYILIGVSLGGMLATEMSTFMKPQKVIIVSSAKNRNELPRRYRFQTTIPLYKIVGPGLAKSGARILQPIVEPDRKNEKETCKAMLKDKDKVFLKRTIAMIINWERTESPENITHIHGDNDHTIPMRNTNPDFILEDGSHMMMLTRADEIGKIINQIIHQP